MTSTWALPGKVLRQSMPLPTDSRLTEKTSLACGKISCCRARYLFHEATKALELPALTDQAYQFPFISWAKRRCTVPGREPQEVLSLLSDWRQRASYAPCEASCQDSPGPRAPTARSMSFCHLSVEYSP
jgi:hypothetical protein